MKTKCDLLPEQQDHQMKPFTLCSVSTICMITGLVIIIIINRRVTVRDNLVHVVNSEQYQVSADRQTKPTNLNRENAIT